MSASDFTVPKPLFSPGKRMRLPTVVVRGDMLASWLTVSGYTRARLATELGVTRGRISQLLTSREEPSAHLIARLMTLTRLPFDRLFKIVREVPPVPISARTITKQKTSEAVLQAS